MLSPGLGEQAGPAVVGELAGQAGVHRYLRSPARQRSLDAAVDWSYQLLPPPEQRVFRYLSVFPGPFSLEAAEAVAGPDAEPAVLHLVDCSLLALQEGII
jgi:predicted ATPase